MTPDQLGSLLDGVGEPDLWFLDELVECAGKVLARSGPGRLVFVGRSLDSMFDLLSGAVPERVVRLPFSFSRPTRRVANRWELFGLLDDWIDETREPWDVIRRQLRFVGVTIREKSSPNTWRWQQHADWTSRLPARSVVNVSLSAPVWGYFGNNQTKLTRSFRPTHWLAEDDGPNRDERTRQALAEAVALVAYGRGKVGRRAIARASS